MMSPWETFAHKIPAKKVKLARLVGKCVIYLCIKFNRREPEIGLVADSLSLPDQQRTKHFFPSAERCSIPGRDLDFCLTWHGTSFSTWINHESEPYRKRAFGDLVLSLERARGNYSQTEDPISPRLHLIYHPPLGDSIAASSLQFRRQLSIWTLRVQAIRTA